MPVAMQHFRRRWHVRDMNSTSIGIAAELEKNGAWLRRLARSLVGDERADDLAQETMAAALKNPPALDRPVKPWLRRVLGNVIRQDWRTESRRRRREKLVSESEQRTSEQTPLATLRMHKQLVEAVMDLSDIYQRAIVMRYVEGLSAADIARRCELSPGTVRSRIARGLEMLRLDLDQRSDGDRESWRAALLPLAVPTKATVAPVSTGALVKVAMMVLVVGAATAVALILMPPRNTKSSTGATGDKPDVASVVLRDDEKQTPPRASADQESPTPGRFRSDAEREVFAAQIAVARGDSSRPRKTYDYSGDRVTPALAVAGAPQEKQRPPTLDKSYIRSRIRSAIPFLVECHQLAAVRTPGLEGTMTVDFIVDAEEDIGGYVREAQLTEESPLTDELLAECVIQTILSLEFVPPEAGGEVLIRYPLTFAIERSSEEER